MSAPGINPLLTSLQGWQLQISGAMNSAIHHPSWYRLVDLITDEQREDAIKARPTTGPILSSFLLGDGEIQCQPTTWSISSVNIEDMTGPVKLASSVFDEKLPHTPVHSYSFMFFFHSPAPGGGDLRTRLAKAMTKAGIGLTPPHGAVTQFSYSFEEGDRHDAILVEPSQRNAQGIFLRYQATHFIQPTTDATGRPVFEQFSIRSRLHEHAALDREAARTHLNRIINGIRRIEE